MAIGGVGIMPIADAAFANRPQDRMPVREFRIPLPLLVEDYRVAQMYMIDKKVRAYTDTSIFLPFPTGTNRVAAEQRRRA